MPKSVIFGILFFLSGMHTAYAQMGNIPTFQLQGAWQVKALDVPENFRTPNLKLPCVVLGEYDNGFVVRLSGGDQRILAMAVDFRQNAFVKGNNYQAELMIDGIELGRLTATAATQSSLVFNAQSLNNFYGALERARMMSLNIDGNAFRFGLSGFSGAMQSMEQCFTSGFVKEVYIPREPRTPGIQMSQSAASERPKPITHQPVISTRVDGQSFTARAGEDIRGVLSRWSNQAGTDLVWQSDRSGALVQDIAVNGSFEDAVQILMAQNGDAIGLNSNFKNASHMSGSARWQAGQGDDLYAVLQRWAAQENVALVWNSERAFSVPNSIQSTGSFDMAVADILEAFAQNRFRPMGQLNVDPVTRQKTLIIKSMRTS